MANPKSPIRKLISVIVPVWNEEENVERAYEAIVKVMEEESDRYDFEIVFTDNHSTDDTFPRLCAIAADDGRVRVYRFSRNFGFQKSIDTAYRCARGDAAVQLDCDLQDPPELIPEFLRRWEDGYRVVYGVRRSRQEGATISWLRRVFYWGIDRISDDDLPRDAGDFRLVDRRIMDELGRLRDARPYLRGRIASLGFDQVGVPYDRRARAAGSSSFSFRELVDLALDGIVNHSVAPLRLAVYAGLALVVGSVAALVFYSAAWLVQGAAWPTGFATLVVLLLLGMGLNGVFLGVVGEYLARVYEQLKMPAEPIIETAVESPEVAARIVDPPAASEAPPVGTQGRSFGAEIRGREKLSPEGYVCVYQDDRILVYERVRRS